MMTMMMPLTGGLATSAVQPWPASAPQIQSANWLLRLVQQSDLAMLMKVNGDDLVTRHLPYPTWRSMSDAHGWFTRTQARTNEGGHHTFAVVNAHSHEVVGCCLLFNHDATLGIAELGFVLGRPYWRQGVMREVLPALLQHAFGEAYGLRALEARTHPENLPSNRLLERLGFKRCATRHDADHGTTWVWRLPAPAKAAGADCGE